MQRSSMFGRALLALLLMVGFYALAATVVGICWGGAWWIVTESHRIPVKLVAIMAIVGAVVLWSVLPRWDRFEAPGPLLTPSEHPALFRALSDVARKTGQPMPHEVYLVGDVNAFVANRGGIMGIGSRPVMGLGLPLMQALTVPEMCAVIAHEFGHYVGGDTRIGPWIYKTRAAIVRSVQNLAQAQSVVMYPFLWYMKVFLRVSHAVSRQQEFAADAVSARVTSAEDAGRALRKVHAIAPAYDAYWKTEVVPLLEEGHRPPVADGFGRFLGEAKIAALVGAALLDVPEENADPYDTHPPLSQRLDALGQRAEPPVPAPAPPAVTLLGDVAAAEAALIGSLLRPEHVVKPVSWDQVGPVLYPRLWANAITEFPALGDLTLRRVPAALADPVAYARELAPGKNLAPETARKAVKYYVGTVIGRALLQAGWTVESLPGRAVTVRRGEHARSLDDLVALAQGDGWVTALAGLGVGEAALDRPNRVA